MGRAHEVRKAAMAKTAAKKTKLYSYYGKEIYLAAKAGGPEPDGNLSLRRLIEKAKKDQVPGDVIKRAIDKVKNGAVEDYESVQFEGFGPSGSTVIAKKGATFYAVAVSVCRLCSLLLAASDTIVSVSTMLHGEYGIEDVCLSTMASIGPNGVKRIVRVPLTEEETEKLHASANALKDVIAQIDL